MSFTIGDFEDPERMLAEHPEWRARLRPLILGDEFLQVPQRLNRIDERLEQIPEQLKELGNRVALRADVVAESSSHLDRLGGRASNHDGQLLELRYDRNIGHWFFPVAAATTPSVRR